MVSVEYEERHPVYESTTVSPSERVECSSPSRKIEWFPCPISNSISAVL